MAVIWQESCVLLASGTLSFEYAGVLFVGGYSLAFDTLQRILWMLMLIVTRMKDDEMRDDHDRNRRWLRQP